jgi:hypothetical protein
MCVHAFLCAYIHTYTHCKLGNVRNLGCTRFSHFVYAGIPASIGEFCILMSVAKLKFKIESFKMSYHDLTF